MAFEADEGGGKTSLLDGVGVDGSPGGIAADVVDVGASRHVGGFGVGRSRATGVQMDVVLGSVVRVEIEYLHKREWMSIQL